MIGSVLVTGGSGYLGSHISKLLYRNHWNIHILDLEQPKHNYYNRYYWSDIRDRTSVRKIFEENQYDYVIHLASRIEVGESMKHPTEFWDVNVGGTVNILNAMKNYGDSKLLFSSTAGLYWPSKNPLKEEDCRVENSVYSNTKVACESAIRDSGIDHMIFRYFNLAGADPECDIGESHEPETHLIPNIFRKLNNFTVYGNDYDTSDGTCVRDYVHVCDVADAHLNAIKYLNSGRPSEIVNLGSGQGHSILQVVQTFEDLYSIKVYCHFGSRRSGDPDSLVADISRARNLLNYSPKHDLKSIIKTAYEWHKKIDRT
jgi:UDP-glucose 4-epimerase